MLDIQSILPLLDLLPLEDHNYPTCCSIMPEGAYVQNDYVIHAHFSTNNQYG